MVPTKTVADNVLTQGFAAIVLKLMIALQRGLWRQVIRPGDQSRAAHLYFQGIIGQRQTAAGGGVYNLVLEFEIFETDAVREAPGVEIQADDVSAGNVLVVVNRETEPRISQQRILEITEAIKDVRRLSKLVIRLGHEIVLNERRIKGP